MNLKKLKDNTSNPIKCTMLVKGTGNWLGLNNYKFLGEQRDRGYDWKVDPKNHRFGKENPQITKEMNHVLQPEFTQDT